MAEFGEGFVITLIIATLWACIIGIAMVYNNEVAKSLVTPMMTVLLAVVAFWFPTRGQTSNKEI